MFKLILAVLVGLTLLTGCNEQKQLTPMVYDKDGNPVAQAAPPQDNSLLYGLGGFMLGNMLGRSSSPAVVQTPSTHTTIVKEKTIIKEVPVPKKPQSVPSSVASPSRLPSVSPRANFSRSSPSFRSGGRR